MAALLQAGRLAEAETLIAVASVQHPGHPRVLCNQARLAWRHGRTAEALGLWQASLDGDPGLISAMVDLGSALLQLGELRSALRWTALAADADPAEPDLWANLAQLRNRLGEAEAALLACGRGLTHMPEHARCRRERMVALHRLGRMAEAASAAQEFLDTTGGLDATLALAILGLHAAETGDWDSLATLPDRLTAAAAGPQADASPMALVCLLDDPEAIAAVARIRARNLRVASRPPRRQPRDGRTTIAYLSPDLGEHPVGHMLLELLPAHDRSRFRVLACALARDDGSAASAAIRRQCDATVELAGLDDAAASAAIRELGVEVLIDLVGSTQGSRPTLLALRPAPVQLLWLGCPCTTGADYYDGFLLDGVAAPPGGHCSEPIVRLPCCYHPIGTGLGNAPSPMQRSSLGLPADAIVVGMVQHHRKLMPGLAQAVASALASHPSAHLLIRLPPAGRARIVERFVAWGVARERLHELPVFQSRSDYLAACQCIDLAVDTYPFGGHSTTGELLSLGVPVVTVLGRSLQARVSASMLHEFALDDLIAPSLAGLNTILDALLADPGRLAGVRRRTAAAGGGHSERLVRALEQTYVTALRRAAIV